MHIGRNSFKYFAKGSLQVIHLTTTPALFQLKTVKYLGLKSIYKKHLFVTVYIKIIYLFLLLNKFLINDIKLIKIEKKLNVILFPLLVIIRVEFIKIVCAFCNFICLVF